VTGIRELSRASAASAAPEHVRVSVVGGRTQLDVALPVDIPVATLLPELVTLVRSRDEEAPADSPWPATPHMFWVLSRLEPPTPLQPSETLRAAGVVNGELLRLVEERALVAPTLYDDVVDAAARLNKAGYAGWNAAAARWMSFVGLGVAALVWMCLLGQVTGGVQRAFVVGLAVVVVATMVGFAALAHRSYGRADVAAVAGWSTIPIGAAIVWTLVRGFGDYGVAAGCALLVVLSAASYWAIGTGRWGYLASGVLFAGGGLAMVGRALAVPPQTVGAVWAVVGALTCLAVSRLTRKLVRVESSTGSSGPDREALILETPFTPPPAVADSAVDPGASGEMPTAEAVWARVRRATVTTSALYAGLAVSVLCGVAATLRAGPRVNWAALVFAAVCAVALGVYARVPGSVLERVSLGVPAVGVGLASCVSAQNGTPAMAWAGYGVLLTVAVVASVTGLRVAGGNSPHRRATAWAYLQYAAYGALIPLALWAVGSYTRLGIR